MAKKKSNETEQTELNLGGEESSTEAAGAGLETGKVGSLVVVGTGIKAVGQLTLEAMAWMKRADTLLYVVGDPIAEEIIKRCNPDAVSLATYYQEGMSRIHTYNAMIEHILGCVRNGEMTVGAFYGHPGVFAYPSHESIRRARAEGYSAKMLPGISAEDCLFADLGVDPAVSGCQSYEATDFLFNNPVVDSSSQLILWQIGTLGDWTFQTRQYDTRAMPLLVQRLSQYYPLEHPVVLYEAATLPNVEHNSSQIPLGYLSNVPVTSAMTLYIPPARTRQPDQNFMQSFTAMGGKMG
ncbi:MAG TPA: SAM-dependent methyltransferase [Pyrinomonadaceae bacterium]|jgi:uncharacterized protein YabN with tetrapyrrole methylase and pyrophosphatase domain